MKLLTITLTLLLTFTGCATARIPGAEAVTFTKNPKDVEGCKLAGTFYSSKKGLSDRAIELGGDTVYIRSNWLAGTVDGGGNGAIYNCKGVDTRQPVPVQVKP